MTKVGDKSLVSREEFFTLKKFELKKKPLIDDTKMPKNLKKYIDKM